MSGLVQRAAAGDLAAIEELRSILSKGPRPEALWAGGTDARRRMPPTLQDFTSMDGDELTIKVLANQLRLQAPPPLPAGLDLVYLPAEAVAAEKAVAGGEVQKGRLRFPWRHRGRRHHGLG